MDGYESTIGDGECDDECTELGKVCVRPSAKSNGTCQKWNLDKSCGKKVKFCIDGNF
jgi:hypothetical protein